MIIDLGTNELKIIMNSLPKYKNSSFINSLSVLIKLAYTQYDSSGFYVYSIIPTEIYGVFGDRQKSIIFAEYKIGQTCQKLSDKCQEKDSRDTRWKLNT